MRGIFEKDYRCYQKTVLMMFGLAVVFIVLWILIPGVTVSHQVNYIAWMGAIASVNVITDDERNGYAFLMTLPVDARSYVFSKFFFVIAVEVQFWIISRAVLVADAIVEKSAPETAGLLTAGYGFYIAAIVFLMVTLVFVLKFGTKALVYLMVAVMVLTSLLMLVAVAALLIPLSTKGWDWYYDILAKIAKMQHIGLYATAAAVAVTALCTWLSIRILKNKEF